MRLLLALLIVLSAPPAHAQNQQCRTAPVGTSTANCASEAFVTESIATSAGNVSGPAVSTNNAVPRWNGATGKLLFDSSVLIDGSDNISGAASFTTPGALSGGSVAGAMVALKADQTTPTSASKIVNPAIQQNHPSAVKAWVKFAGSGTNGPQTISASYNVSGVARTSAGLYAITFSPTSFASADYVCTGSEIAGGTNGWVQFATPAAGSIVADFITLGPAVFDPGFGMIACEGTQ